MDFDDFIEYFERLLVVVFVFCILFVPIYLILRPNPTSYFKFLYSVRKVRIDNDPNKSLWLPVYFGPIFLSYFFGQAVRTNLHYPLLVETLGASVLQVGLLDAAAQTIAAGLDITLRSSTGPLKNLSRSSAFVLQAIVSGLGFGFIVGYVVPSVSHKWLALMLVALTQTFDSLQLAFSEFGVMRNDAKEDIVRDDSVKDEKWHSSGKVINKLAQLTVVARYPATLLASLVFGQFISHIFTAYMIIGVGGALLGLWLAFAWRHHEAQAPDMVQEKKECLTDDLKPGGRYFGVIARIGVYNALSEVVRNGYPRMINLRALTMENVPSSDISLLLTVTFGISVIFFWISDIGSKGSTFEKISRNRARAGALSFALLGSGHFLMGQAEGFKGLLTASIFFGFGQAGSTGLRTVWKDEVRALLRCDGHGESYRKRMLRILAGVGSMTSVVNSLVVGIVGDTYGLSCACSLYAGLAVLGLLCTFWLNADLRSLLADESQRVDISVEELTEEEGGLAAPIAKAEAAKPLLGRHNVNVWHESASSIYN